MYLNLNVQSGDKVIANRVDIPVADLMGMEHGALIEKYLIPVVDNLRVRLKATAPKADDTPTT